MPTGLRNPLVIGRIVAAMNTALGNWAGSIPMQRASGIANVVMAELRAINVLAPNLQVANFPGLAGQFDFAPWTLQVDMGMTVGRVGQTQNDIVSKIAELGDTIAHEARHCEQWFRMARLLADQRRAKGLMVDGRELANRLSISMQAGNAASAAGPLSVPERREAEEWYESVYGSAASFRQTTYATKLKPTGGLSGNDWQTSSYSRYQRGLAEEEDAFALGTEVQRQFLQGFPGVQPPAYSRHAPVRSGVTSY